ncbi:hypothetical protein AFCA_012795 [Aspergillus flavus]|nr:hypothetical protein AFCA_012795 [Aspergillus flavus]
MGLELLSNGQLSAPRHWGTLSRESQQSALLATTQDKKEYFSLHSLPWTSKFLSLYTISISVLFILSSLTQLYVLRHKKTKTQ